MPRGRFEELGSDLVRRTLRDGTEIDIRPIRADDKDLLAGGFERLSPESRYRRFFSPTASLTPSQLRYLTEVDHHTHEALLALEVGTGEGVGVARFVRSGDDPAMAEVAVAVVDGWQGRGVATILLHDLAARAREEGIERFSASVLAGNEAMMAVFRDLADVRVTGRGEGEVDLVMDLPEEGIPAALSHAVRGAARGELEHRTR